MKNHQEIEGIIEIASFQGLAKLRLIFSLRVAGILGSAVTNIKIADERMHFCRKVAFKRSN